MEIEIANDGEFSTEWFKHWMSVPAKDLALDFTLRATSDHDHNRVTPEMLRAINEREEELAEEWL